MNTLYSNFSIFLMRKRMKMTLKESKVKQVSMIVNLESVVSMMMEPQMLVMVRTALSNLTKLSNSNSRRSAERRTS